MKAFVLKFHFRTKITSPSKDFRLTGNKLVTKASMQKYIMISCNRMRFLINTAHFNIRLKKPISPDFLVFFVCAHFTYEVFVLPALTKATWFAFYFYDLVQSTVATDL